MARQKTGGRTKAVLFLVGSLLVAALTAVIVLQVLRRSLKELEEANKPPPTVSVVVAKNDLYMGIPIEPEDVVEREVLPEMVPTDYVYASVEEVINETPKERILANEVIRMERLARPDAGIGLNAIITSGKRAMTIKVDIASGVAFMLRPGNYVDVIMTIRPDDKDMGAKWVTETILQAIRVLAVDSSTTPSNTSDEDGTNNKKKQRNETRRNKPSVTVEVTPEEAEKLALASSRGDIHLVLRSDVDTAQYENEGVMTANELIGYEKGKTPVKSTGRRGTRTSSPSGPSAEVIQGSDTEDVKFDAAGNKIEPRKRGR